MSRCCNKGWPLPRYFPSEWPTLVVIFFGLDFLQSFGNPQVSVEDVKLVAAQLGFKGKDELVMELRTTIQGEGGPDGPGGPDGQDGPDGDINVDEQGSRSTLGEKAGLVAESRAGQDRCEDLHCSGEPRNVVDDVMICEEEEIPDGGNGAADGGKNDNEGYVNASLAQEVGELAEHEGFGQLDREDIQSVGGNVQGIDGEVPGSQVEFRGALEEDTASQSARATSTPVAVAKSLIAHHDDPDPISLSERDAGKVLIDDNGNLESEDISEARATFSMGALMVREGIQGGIVEASADGEQDMDLDHSLMEKTRESQIDLGSGDQGPRSRSKSASRLMTLLKSSSRKRRMQQGPLKVGLHKGMLKKTINYGKGFSKDLNKNVVQKEKTKLRFVRVMQEMEDIKQQHVEGSHNKRIQMRRDAQTNQIATSVQRECRKCGKEVRRDKGYICVACAGVFHVKCSLRKLEGEGWVCKGCKKQVCGKQMQKQDEAGDSAAKAGKVTGRSQSVSTVIAIGSQEGLVRQVAEKEEIKEGGKPSACKNCSGCARKKGCKEIAKWKEVQKQPGGAVSNKVRKEARCSQSVSTNAGRVTRWGGVDQGSRKRRMDRSEALEGKRPEAEMRLEDKQARNGKRVSFKFYLLPLVNN